jgi:hypothetical protein
MDAPTNVAPAESMGGFVQPEFLMSVGDVEREKHQAESRTEYVEEVGEWLKKVVWQLE